MGARYFCAQLGEKNTALEALTKGVDEKESNAFWYKVDSLYYPLRDDPRFQDLLRRMNLEL